MDRVTFTVRVLLIGTLAAKTLSVPFVPREKDACAAASLAMVLRHWSVDVAQGDMAKVLLQPELRGILGSRLEAFAHERGLTAIA